MRLKDYINEGKSFDSGEMDKWKKAFKGKTIMDVKSTKDYLYIQFRLGDSDETNVYEVVKKGNGLLAKNYYTMNGEDDSSSPDSSQDIKGNSIDQIITKVQKEIKSNR